MGRPIRVNEGGLVYHVLNRGNARMRIFDKDADYEAFETILAEACKRCDMRLLAYCLMPNHWHLVLWPREDGDLSAFVGWLTLTHTQRWHAHRDDVGTGHVYQGRFKSFVVQADEHLVRLCRYVERNPLRAGLVDRAEDWLWGSLWLWRHADARRPLLSSWPIDRPRRWLSSVNRMEDEQQLAAQRCCVNRGRPYGSEVWVQRTARRLGLETTLRPRGRPRQKEDVATRSKGS